MTAPEKSVNQFVKEMREAGLSFEFKASSNDGRVVQSKGWVDDETIYTEISPVLEYKKPVKQK